MALPLRGAQNPEEMPCRLILLLSFGGENRLKHIGIDLHKRKATVAELHPDGTVKCYEVTLDNIQSIDSFLHGLNADDKVAFEATTNSHFLYRLIKPLVNEVVLVHPKRMRAIAESLSKTDAKDAEILARTLASGLLKGSYVPSPDVQAQRGLLVHRHKIVGEKTSVKNRIHALLGSYGFTSPLADLFGKAGRNTIERVKGLLPPDAQVELTSCIRMIEWYEKEIGELDEHLAVIASSDPYVELLMTISGMDMIAALSISAYIVDVSRFSTGRKLAAYAGIVPIVRNSNGKKHCGPITKAGPPVLRWALIEVAQSLVKVDGPVRNLYRRTLRKRGDSSDVKGKAIVACANKLARIIWKMLVGGEPYKNLNASLYKRKIVKLHKVARPYQHTVEDCWSSGVLTPSLQNFPSLSETESPEVVRLRIMLEIMRKTGEKHRVRKKAS